MRKKCAITIGNFDGVHHGHVSVLNRLKKIAKQHHLTPTALTFSNHPSTVFKPDNPTPALCTLPHKLKLLKDQGVSNLLVYPFTREFSEQSPEEFLNTLMQTTPFSHLILGHDAAIGKARQGNREIVERLAEKLQFTVEYQPIYKTADEVPVSSSLIRRHLKEGDLQLVEQFLGRKFSIYQKITSGKGLGKETGFPTANLSVEGLCLPPLGVYAVEFVQKGRKYSAIANLGFAPTLKQENTPLLEVHVLDPIDQFQNSEVEVIFHQFIRPEQKFVDLNALQQQIAKDIEQVKALF